jgi:hypothetical protein
MFARCDYAYVPQNLRLCFERQVCSCLHAGQTQKAEVVNSAIIALYPEVPAGLTQTILLQFSRKLKKVEIGTI